MNPNEFEIDDDIPEVSTGKELDDIPEETPEYEFEAQEDKPEASEETQEDDGEEAPVQAKKPKKSVQERINKAVKAQREAERRAAELAQRLEIIETRVRTNEDAYRAAEESNVNTEHETLRAKHKAALEGEDYEEAEKLSDKLLDLKIKKRELEAAKRQAPAQELTYQQPVGPDPQTARWVRENSDWWEVDEAKTRRALVIDYELKLDGYNPQDQDFWDELDARLAPQQSKQKKRPTQQVATADRGGLPAKKGRLLITREQQHIASELGIKPNTPEWDRFIKNLQAQGGVNA